MATYAEAAQARTLIDRVASLNNSLIGNLSALMGIRGELLALSQAARDVVVAAIGDMGYDATEIQTIIAKWKAVDDTANAQGVYTVQR